MILKIWKSSTPYPILTKFGVHSIRVIIYSAFRLPVEEVKSWSGSFEQLLKHESKCEFCAFAHRLIAETV